MATLVLAGACSSSGSGSSSSGAGATRPSGSDLPPCPLDALASATQPVEVVLWHPLADLGRSGLEPEPLRACLGAWLAVSDPAPERLVTSGGEWIRV